MERKYYWLKLKNDFFATKEMKKLRKIAGGDTYTIIYLKLQLLSLTDEGKLYYDGIEESFAEELALTIDEDADNVKATLLFLEKCGLVELNGTELFMCNVPSCIGSETSAAERMREFRRNRVEQSANKVTQKRNKVQNCYTEIDIDKEKEKDIETEKRKKRSLAAVVDQVITDLDVSEELKASLKDFVAMRKAIKAPITDRGLSIIINKLFQMGADDETRIEILEQSISNSWKGIFPLHKEVNKPKNKAEQKEQETVDMLQDWISSRKGAE